MKISSAIEDLREKLIKACEEPVNARAEAVVSELVDYDPMQALDDIEEEDERGASPAAKKTKYSPKRLANRVFTLDMPELPPECAGSAVAGIRSVRVLGRSTNQVWLSVEDVPWLVKHVATEVALGGVAEVTDAAAAEGNCEVPDLRTQRDFPVKAGKQFLQLVN